MQAARGVLGEESTEVRRRVSGGCAGDGTWTWRHVPSPDPWVSCRENLSSLPACSGQAAQGVCPSASVAGESRGPGKCYPSHCRWVGRGSAFPPQPTWGHRVSRTHCCLACAHGPLCINPRSEIGGLRTHLPPCHPVLGPRERSCHGQPAPPHGHKGGPHSRLSSPLSQVKKAVLHFSRTLLNVQGLGEWAWELVAYIVKQASLSSSQTVREMQGRDLVLMSEQGGARHWLEQEHGAPRAARQSHLNQGQTSATGTGVRERC